ncbi:hypothetical protein A3762_15440 [Oleiphilus sp. HI0125]|nr:hypothetical protein A3762_15440 [Oleiphilus sp. HI0125]
MLVTLNCATLPSELTESELFGHEKGAFTGADKAKRGKFKLADNGTLFLDEIGELPLALQAKLLRALQQGEIQRLGSKTSIRVNCRVIAATNRNLSDEVAKGRFREDLYHRLNVFPVQSPALRERHGDIPLLIEFFTKQWKSKIGIDEIRYSDQAMQILNEYAWPENVRELENMVARILVTEQSRSNDKQVLYLNERSIPISTEQTNRALNRTIVISNETDSHNTD